MEELQVIETTSGRQFKPWVTNDDLQAAVQDPASITAITSEIAGGKQAIAQAINAKGGSASETESFSELAEAVGEIPDFNTVGTQWTTNPSNLPDAIAYCNSKLTYLKCNIESVSFDSFLTFIKYCETLELPELVSIVGSNALNNLPNLQHLNLPKLYSVNGTEFLSHIKINKITLPKLASLIGDAAFNGNTVSEYYFPELKNLNSLYSISNTTYIIDVFSAPQLTNLSGHLGWGYPPIKYLYLNSLQYIGSGAIRIRALVHLELGQLTSVHGTAFQGTDGSNCRFISIGDGTNINIPFSFWNPTNVIAEGQSGIDELNSNLYNNILTKLYDHSNDGETRTLRIGWLANVTAENIAYANAKGWTLTT